MRLFRTTIRLLWLSWQNGTPLLVLSIWLCGLITMCVCPLDLHPGCARVPAVRAEQGWWLCLKDSYLVIYQNDVQVMSFRIYSNNMSILELVVTDHHWS
jgi:hypothetical protein